MKYHFTFTSTFTPKICLIVKKQNIFKKYYNFTSREFTPLKRLFGRNFTELSPPSPPPPSPPPHTPTPITPPPPRPPLFNMANTMKIPIFIGMGKEDPEQFWFVADSVWKSQQVTNDDLKKVQLVTTQ